MLNDYSIKISYMFKVIGVAIISSLINSLLILVSHIIFSVLIHINKMAPLSVNTVI
jgi:hypothetical protein